MYWLIERQALAEMRRAIELHGALGADLSAKRDEWARVNSVAARSDSQPRNLVIAGDVAEISVSGILLDKPDFWLWLLDIDHTIYSDIQSAIATAESDPNVKSIVYGIDSPGGTVAGLFETLAALEAVTKKRSVRASLACSAAYSIAAVAGGKIHAVNAASTFGSVGVAASYLVEDDVVDITSTEAPDKRPDPSTAEGQAVIREYLDAIHDLFVEAIAAGRGTDKATVNAEYGRGALVIASEAKRRGMIDSIQKPQLRPVAVATDITGPAAVSDPGTHSPETSNKMDAEELKAKHPDTYAKIFSFGEAKERSRVTAHLKLGKSSGAMEAAEKFIAEGKSVLDEDVHAEYLSASMNRKAQDARQQDSDTADASTAGGNTASEPDMGDQVVAHLEQMVGAEGAVA